MTDSEKITINMGAVDLGKVDVLVNEGVYANRTDFIRTAIRNQLDKHGVEVQHSVARHSYVMGMVAYDRKQLERMKAEGARVSLNVIGALTLDDDVPPDLAAEVIERLKVRGIFRASGPVKAALADRTN